jgi:hypothetical protein
VLESVAEGLGVELAGLLVRIAATLEPANAPATPDVDKLAA